MKPETKNMLSEFEISNGGDFHLYDKHKGFEKYLKDIVSGEGCVGEEGYLVLWDKDKIEYMNEGYEVENYLKDVILIGSDGGDTAYGIDKNGRYLEVPFIGMGYEEVEFVADNFDEFIKYIFFGE